MKRISSIVTAILLTTTLWAQSPEKMSYQAVIRNSTDQLVTDQQIGIQISILLGSAGGTTVYVETQTPMTNTNGLISIKIGGETGFDAIEWANGPYFIKTETDPTGGTNYTITGTSQLLSVPYALHAKSAETVTGTIIESDPVFRASIANGITATDTTNWNNKQDQLTAGRGIDITNDVISASAHYIGESYGGGVVFYVYDNGQRGLIADTADQSTGIQWYNGTYRYTGTTGDGLGAGAINTAMIVATQMADNQIGNFAAKVCADYSVTVGGVTYGDWYLPSKYELNLLFLQKSVVGGFATTTYWSSSEGDNNTAWTQSFNSGAQGYVNKGNPPYVRAVRAF